MIRQSILILLASLAVSPMALAAPIPPMPVTAQSLLADLAGPDDVAQTHARRLLPREGVTVIPELCALLSHEQERVWRAAWNTLSDLAHALGTPDKEDDLRQLADELTDLLKGDTPVPVKERVLKLLPFAVPDQYELNAVGALLKDPATAERARVALREIASEEAARTLSRAVRDVAPEFVPAIAEALGSIGDTVALSQLDKLARDKDAAVRAVAVRGLAQSGDLGLASEMRQAHKKATPETLRDVEDAWLRWLQAAGERGGNVERLMGLYEELLSLSTNDIIRGGAVAGLARYGDERGAKKLSALLQEDTALSSQALYTMRFQQGREADVAFRNGFAAVNPKYRAQYVQQLATRQSPVLVDTFRAALADADLPVKQAALQGLVRLGGAEAIEPLKAAAQDEALRPGIVQSLITLGRDFGTQGNRDAAGRAYLAAHGLAPDDATRSEALEGVKANPSPEAAPLLVALDDAALAAMPIATLDEIRRTVEAAGMAERAAALDAVVTAKLAEPGAVAQLITHADATGQGERWKDKLGFVRQWNVAGPFPFLMAEGFQPHINEPAVDINATYASAEGAAMKWQAVRAEGTAAYVGLDGLFGMLAQSCAYAYATVSVPEDTDAVLTLGSDDGIRAWVNGAQVHDNNIDRGALVDSDLVPVKLTAGQNTILLQISQNGGGWVYVARLTQADGKPLVFENNTPAPQTQEKTT
jgi:HEAT repeat protein